MASLLTPVERERRQRAVDAVRMELDSESRGWVEDLRSTGVAEATVGPLDELLKRLRGLMAQAAPGAAEVDRLWAQAEAVLRGFGEGAARREGFWK